MLYAVIYNVQRKMVKWAVNLKMTLQIKKKVGLSRIWQSYTASTNKKCLYKQNWKLIRFFIIFTEKSLMLDENTIRQHSLFMYIRTITVKTLVTFFLFIPPRFRFYYMLNFLKLFKTIPQKL